MDTEWVARVIQRDEGSTDIADKVYPFATGDVNLDNNTITFQKSNDEIDSNPKLLGNICVLIVKQANPEPIVFASFWVHTYFMEFNNNQSGKQELIIKIGTW